MDSILILSVSRELMKLPGVKKAVPYMVDSTATESYGMGAFSAAAAPTVLQLRGSG